MITLGSGNDVIMIVDLTSGDGSDTISTFRLVTRLTLILLLLLLARLQMPLPLEQSRFLLLQH